MGLLLRVPVLVLLCLVFSHVVVPEMVQVLEVNVPLVEVKIWASAYFVCSHIHRSDMRRG